jgi:hypothetical protein
MKKHLSLISLVFVLLIIASLLLNQSNLALGFFCLTLLTDAYQIFILKEKIKDLEHPQY